MRPTYLLLTLSLAACGPIQGIQGVAQSKLKQETDDRETNRSQQLVDVTSKVEEFVNSVLAESRVAVNPDKAPWTPELTAEFLEEFAHRSATPQPGSGIGVNIGNLSLEISKFTKTEFNLMKRLDPAKNEILAIKYVDSRYNKNPVDLIDGRFPAHKTSFTADHSIAPVLRLGRTLIGIDKIGHFMEQGWWYFQAEKQGMLSGPQERWAFGQYMEGDDALPDSEHKRYDDIYGRFCWVCTIGGGFGFFGARSTGVVSYGDIYANENGYQFFDQLSKDPGDHKFRLADYQFDKWNEEISPSKFVGGLEAE